MWTVIIIGIVLLAAWLVYVFFKAGKEDKAEAAQKAEIKAQGDLANNPFMGGQTITTQVAIPAPEVKPSSTPRLLLFIGALMMIIGPIFPVINAYASLLGNYSLKGYDGDGIIQGILGVILLLFAAAKKGRSGNIYSVAAGILALIGVAISFEFLIRITTTVTEAALESSLLMTSTGIGLYIPLIGAIIAAIACFIKS